MKKIFYIYFLFFILLNIVDFFNLLPKYLDIFKKFLSWGLIGYFFYKLSPTKIFLGNQKNLMDFLIIICFYLISTTKSFFYFFKLKNDLIIEITFLIGFFFLILICIDLILNTEIKKDSLLGSFNFKNFFLNFLILLSSFLFFSFIIFNFFSEWFAIAIDSLILILGLIYYLFNFLLKKNHYHTIELSKKISNFGQNFFYKIINYFSNKKTFFHGCVLILTITGLVDIGVFLIPYIFGIKNSFYNIEDSILNSFIEISKEYLFLSPIIFIEYLLSILFIFFILFFAFYFFYNHKKTEKILNNKYIIYFLLISIINFLLFKILKLIPIFDFRAYKNNTLGTEIILSNLSISNDFYILIFFLFFISFFLIYILKKNFLLLKKILIFFGGIFFILYIGIFSFSIIGNDINKIYTENYISIEEISINGKQTYITKFDKFNLKETPIIHKLKFYLFQVDDFLRFISNLFFYFISIFLFLRLIINEIFINKSFYN